MTRSRLIVIVAIGAFFTVSLYTTAGCGPTPTGSISFSDVHGIVTNAVSGAPVAGAHVTATQNSLTPQIDADAQGNYVIGLLDKGDVRITVTAAGYRTFTQTITLRDGPNTFNVRLTPAT